MKKISILLILPLLLSNNLFAQNQEAAEKLVIEGVAYHDKEDYEGAISRYDKALDLDRDNLLALTEKSLTLVSMKKNDEAISCCKRAIKNHSGNDGLKNVYVNYGSALDNLKKTDKALEIYDEGIGLFPNYYLLHFNKGITLVSVTKYEDAIFSFQKAVISNPLHGSSHNILARILDFQKKRIPSVLAYARYLVIDPESGRAKENLVNIKRLLKGNAEKTGDNSISINVSPDMLGDPDKKGKPAANSFHSADLVLEMSGALDFDDKNKDQSDVQKFIRKFETICSVLQETSKENHGFYWEYYVPYFTEMNEKKMLETFAYLAFASTNDPDVSAWLNSHDGDINKFYEWSKSFSWKETGNK